MHVVTVTAAHPGIGGTTLTAWLGHCAAMDGAGLVVFLDAGDEPALLAWAEGADLARATAAAWDESCRADSLRRLGDEGVGLVLVDCDVSRSDAQISDILEATDLVVILVPPQYDNLDDVAELLDIVGSADKPFVFVINRAGEDEDAVGATVISLAQFGTVSPVILPQYDSCPLPDGVRAANGSTDAPGIAGDMRRLWEYCKSRLQKQADIDTRTRQRFAMQAIAARYDRPATFVVPEMVYPCHVMDITPQGLVFTSDQDIPPGVRLRINLPYVGQIDCEVAECDSGKVTASFLIGETRRDELLDQVAHLPAHARD